jgi:hypothetical protein
MVGSLDRPCLHLVALSGLAGTIRGHERKERTTDANLCYAEPILK